LFRDKQGNKNTCGNLRDQWGSVEKLNLIGGNRVDRKQDNEHGTSTSAKMDDLEARNRKKIVPACSTVLFCAIGRRRGDTSSQARQKGKGRRPQVGAPACRPGPPGHFSKKPVQAT